MFEWLDKEIAAIKTPRFHVLGAPRRTGIGDEMFPIDDKLPPSYMHFIAKYGSAKLYRQLDGYIVGVLSSPQVFIDQDNAEWLNIGHFQSGRAFFKAALLQRGVESPVFEEAHGRLIRITDGFASWLERRCASARKTYRTERWKAILRGPEPFSPEEHAIVQARRRFTVRVVGRDLANHTLRLAVHNGTQRTLPYLTINARNAVTKLQGGFWLPVGHIQPGQSDTIERQVRELGDLKDVELFAAPDPCPEDRDRYWEFRAVR